MGLFFLLPAVAACFIYLNMAIVTGLWTFAVYVIAISGTMGMMHFSGLLSKTRIAPCLAYIGSKTLYILTFHFLAFVLVSYIYRIALGLPIERLLEQCNEGLYGMMWIVYTIAGITLPILVWEIRHRIAGIHI